MLFQSCVEPIGRILSVSVKALFEMVRVHTHLANQVVTMDQILAPKWHEYRVVVRSMNAMVVS